MLEGKEIVHLHNAVQIDLKKLLRNPPSVKIPRGHDFVGLNPLLGTLLPTVSELLVGSTKETMKLRGATLYSEGSKPNGIWLISNGVVKWASKSISNKHSLHPRFTHGSSLGLYEVLNGRPHICDTITDSVVHCFSIEAEKILAVFNSDPAIEDILWQESATVLAKLLLPEIFEKMPAQEVRALLKEKSTINTYPGGESIKLPHRFIGLLLEGKITIQGTQEELITSPAALFPWYGDMKFRRPETSGIKSKSSLHEPSYYQVEARATVIMLDIAGAEADRVLQRRPSKEHIGLMSWPEHFDRPRQAYEHSVVEKEQEANNLSVRALQLSMHGTMVDNTRRPAQTSPTDEERPSHSSSYPRVPPHEKQPLIYAKSEVASTLGKTVEEQMCKAASSIDRSHSEDEHIVRID